MNLKAEALTIWLLAQGPLTLLIVALSFLAYEDITAGNETDLFMERAVHEMAAIWCLVLTAGLALARRWALGLVSGVALAGAVWAYGDVGPGTVTSLKPEYVATLGALVWFLALSVILLILGSRVVRIDRSSR